MTIRVVAGIFARGGSKGVPRKNIRPLAGKPLIGYAVESARAARTIDRVVVSTDDDEIAETARRFGAEVPFRRPAELASDTAPEWLAWQHAAKFLLSEHPDLQALAVVPTTSPLRDARDIDRCVDLLLESDADVVFTIKPTDRNPWFNMVIQEEDGTTRLVNQPEKPIYRRQDAPPVFDITTGAYVFRPQHLLEAASLFEGRVRSVVISAEHGLEIDTELDFLYLETILTARNKKDTIACKA